MKKLFLLLIVVLSIGSKSFSQIENETKGFVDSTEILISKGRELLVNAVLSKDHQKAIEIYDHLLKMTEERPVKAFDYSEALIFNIITGNFSEFSRLTKNYNELENMRRSVNSTDFFEPFKEEIRNNREAIRESLDKVTLPKEDKQIIEIFLCLIDNYNKGYKYATLYNEFSRIKAITAHDDFFKTYIPKPQKKISLALSLGAAGAKPTQNLGTYFNNYGIGHISMDFSISRFYSGLFIATGSLPVKKSFTVRTGNDDCNFSSNDRFIHKEISILFGLFIERTDNISIALYLTSGATSITSKKYESQNPYKEVRMINSKSVGVGLHSEVKLFDYTPKFANLDTLYGKGYVSLKFDIGIGGPVTVENKDFDGNIAYGRFALVWGFGDF